MYEDKAMMFKVLSDQNRIKILELLIKGETCGCDLLSQLSITQPTLSYHLKILSEAGFLKTVVNGNQHNKYVNKEKLEELEAFLKLLRMSYTTCWYIMEEIMKKKVAFVCVHNSCRSIMAEGFANLNGSDVLEVYSAGTEEYPGPKPMALEVMEDLGIDMSYTRSKLLSDIPSSVDILITMGCNVVCPHVPTKHKEDWGLDDPSGGSKSDFEKTRDLINDKVIDLIKRVKAGVL